MSSHHFVKENQEPALIVYSCDSFSFGNIEQLLEWAPYIIVSSEAAEYFFSRGIHFDVCIGETNLDFPFMYKSIPLENESFLQEVLNEMKDRNQNLNIVFDSEELLRSSLETLTLPDLNIICFSNNKKWILIHNEFERWYPKNKKASFSKNEIIIDGDCIEQDGAFVMNNEGILKAVGKSEFWLIEELILDKMT